MTAARRRSHIHLFLAEMGEELRQGEEGGEADVAADTGIVGQALGQALAGEHGCMDVGDDGGCFQGTKRELGQGDGS